MFSNYYVIFCIQPCRSIIKFCFPEVATLFFIFSNNMDILLE